MIRRIIEDYEAKLKPVGTGQAQAGMRGKAEWEKFTGGMIGGSAVLQAWVGRELGVARFAWFPSFTRRGLV
jgi:hypothetical protein